MLLDMSSVTAAAASARATTTLTMVFKTPSDAAFKDKCDYLGVELPWGWGNVLVSGTASLGAPSLTGVLVNGTAISPAPEVELTKGAVSKRSLVVKVKPTVKDGTTTSNYLG